jgi:hypothetical protein
MGYGRFERLPGAAGLVVARDRLTRRQAPMTDPSAGPAVLVRTALGSAVLPTATGPITARPAAAGDRGFWQYPARTEHDACERHRDHATSPVKQAGDVVDVYLGLPWATWIDMQRVSPTDARSNLELRMQRVRIHSLRRALEACGLGLRVHTVCQHVYWERLVPTWQTLGVTDLWLSHAASASGPSPAGLTLHPWSLWAVNVEDPARRAGLVTDAASAERDVLASFIGTHATHYVSDTRLRLQALATEQGFVLGATDEWHFEQVVYREQIHGNPPTLSPAVDDAVRRYNQLLSRSRFSLCPAGAGANTLRLWESLAAGAVPVLCGPQPAMPQGGTLAPIDWDRIVLRATDEELADLPHRLRAMPLEEVRERQHLGRLAYEAVKAQRCFA